MSLPDEGLLALNRIHRQLEEIFFRHQAAVLNGDGAQARSLLGDYETGLSIHMREEDEILMPLYRERATPIRGGDAEIFTGEHGKIFERLDVLRLRLSRITLTHSPAGDILALLDDEAYFKKFMEHHTLRENRIFYPELERVTTPQEKAGLIRLLTFSLGGLDNPASDA